MITDSAAPSSNSQQVQGEYQKFLAPGEKVVKVFDYATSQFIWDIVWGVLLIPVFLIGLILIAVSLYRKFTLKYLVTDKRVIVKKGLIGQSTISADYSKITDVAVQQGILGRLILHTGTIVLNTAGTDLGEVILKWVQDPFEAKNAIYAHLHKK